MKEWIVAIAGVTCGYGVERDGTQRETAAVAAGARPDSHLRKHAERQAAKVGGCGTSCSTSKGSNETNSAFRPQQQGWAIVSATLCCLADAGLTPGTD